MKQLRFRTDDGSEFPDWEEKRLGDITKKVSRKDENSDADVRMISQGNGFILQANKYSRENAGGSLKKYTLLKRDEFAYNHGASKAKPYGVCYRLCESDEARVPYVYHTFKLVDGNVDYWNCALNTSYMDRQLKKLVSSGVRMDGLLNIKYDSYMSVEIHVPSLPEQQKIADFLSTIDTVIEKQKATVEAWEERKKGVMQKLFSQEVRFKADDGSAFPDWEEKKIESLGDIVGGGTPPTREKKYWCGQTAWVSSADVMDNDIYNINMTRFITHEAINNSATKIIPQNSILIVSRVGVGKVAKAPCDLCTSQEFTNIINPKGDPIFLSYAILNLMKSKLQCVQGTSIKGIPSDEIRNYSLSFPCLAEQQKIADCLSSLDDVIKKQKATLAVWEEMKKGLLQQMFV